MNIYIYIYIYVCVCVCVCVTRAGKMSVNAHGLILSYRGEKSLNIYIIFLKCYSGSFSFSFFFASCNLYYYSDFFSSERLVYISQLLFLCQNCEI